jgi:hypothetical protein
MCPQCAEKLRQTTGAGQAPSTKNFVLKCRKHCLLVPEDGDLLEHHDLMAPEWAPVSMGRTIATRLDRA